MKRDEWEAWLYREEGEGGVVTQGWLEIRGNYHALDDDGHEEEDNGDENVVDDVYELFVTWSITMMMITIMIYSDQAIQYRQDDDDDYMMMIINDFMNDDDYMVMIMNDYRIMNDDNDLVRSSSTGPRQPSNGLPGSRL